jgi:hypothetical protein
VTSLIWLSSLTWGWFASNLDFRVGPAVLG